MSSLFLNGLRHIKLLCIVLTFFIDISSSTCLSDLKTMCCIDSGTDEIQSMPPNNPCTAIAQYSRTSGAPAPKNIDQLKGNLKYAYIYDDLYYREYQSGMINGQLDNFVQKICDVVVQYKIDIFIFKDLYMPPYEEFRGYDIGFQATIYALFERLIPKNPNTLFGILFRTFPDLGFNITYLDGIVPFFLLHSFDYRYCDYHKNASLMRPGETVDEMENAIKSVICQLNKAKLAITIRIIVKSKAKRKAKEEDESYTEYCENGAKKSRRFCIKTLSQFYKEGHLVSKYNLAGAFIQSYDREDYKGECGCGLFPIMSAINAGMIGLPEPIITKCVNWTLSPRDRDD